MPLHARLLAGSLPLLLALMLLGAGPAAAQTPTRAAPSPEELLLGILGYRLQPTDLPSGFTVVNQQAVTPAGRAFDLGNTVDESRAALGDLQRAGLLTGFAQTIGPNKVTPVRIFTYDAELYATEAKASDALRNSHELPSGRGVQSDSPPVPVRLGDESAAVHVTITRPDSNNQAIEALFWRRGRITFSVLLEVLDSTETLDQAVPLAIAADRRAASLTPPARSLPSVESTRSVTPSTAAAGGEDYRVDAAYALYTRLPGPDQSPFGFRPVAPTVITNADLLLRASDPGAFFSRIVNSWKRVLEVERIYNTLQSDSGDVIHVRYALSADSTGATANVLDPQHELGSSVETLGLPSPLGDLSRLYHETYAGINGVRREAWRVVWARGRVVLFAYTTGPAGDFTPRDALGLAAQVDARYTRAPLPGVLTAPLPQGIVPVPVS